MRLTMWSIGATCQRGRSSSVRWGLPAGPSWTPHRTFLDPQGSNRVGLLLEIPDFGAFQEAMQSDQAAQAMSRDGVHPDTLLVLEEA